MKRKIVKTIILIIVYFLTVGYIIYIFPRYNEENYIKKENDFQIVEIKDLKTKFDLLKFDNKTRDDYKVDNVATIKTNIFNKKVTVTITIGNVVRKYILSTLDNVISTRSSIDSESNTHITYLLTEDLKVYKIVDDLAKVKEDENYMGEPKDMGLINVSAIAINQDGKFSLKDKENNKPCVYIKTSDGRMFSDEVLKEKTSLVEVVEKVSENTKKKK